MCKDTFKWWSIRDQGFHRIRKHSRAERIIPSERQGFVKILHSFFEIADKRKDEPDARQSWSVQRTEDKGLKTDD